MADRNRILGTGIDVASAFLAPVGAPAQAISYGVTGKSLGENITGSSLAPGTGRNEAASQMSSFQKAQSMTMQARADALRQNLEQEGRPQMDAELQAAQQAASLAAKYAREGMPEAQYVQASQALDRGMAGALGAASSRGAGMQMLGSNYGNFVEGQRSLASADAMMAQQNQGQYLNALQSLGGAAGRAEYYNELLPYEQKVAEMQALQAGALQNKFGMLNFNYQNQMAQQQMAMNLAGSALGAGTTVASGGMV